LKLRTIYFSRDDVAPVRAVMHDEVDFDYSAEDDTN
jgi:hypothetical protein